MIRTSPSSRAHAGSRLAAILLVAGSVLVLNSCSRSLVGNAELMLDVARIATSGNPAGAARALGRAYARNPIRAVNDLRFLHAEFKRALALLSGKAGKQWGKRNTRLPDRAHYVKYTHNYKSRAVVDFDRGRITVETLVDKDAGASLKNAIVTTLLTPDDPRAVDLFSDASIKLSSRSTPYLYGLVLNRSGRPIGDAKAAERFADWQLAHTMKVKTIRTESGSKTVHYVDMSMVSNFRDEQALKYRPAVQRFARRFGVSESLVFAIIRAESDFNPFAVSPAPAFGLMQLVPSSGGREGYRMARGRDHTPSRSFLFNADNNIELGTAYLGLLSGQQLNGVYNATSREYCVIAAYNTGPSNVLRAFSKDRTVALDKINRSRPPAVYARLIHKLPYKETRRYLQKVVGYRRDYVRL